MRILILLFAFTTFLSAQERDPSERIPQYHAEGSLAALRVVPGDRTARIYLIGRKAAEMDFKKDSKILSVLLSSKNPGELRLNAKGEYYEVEGVPVNQPYELSVRTQVRGQTEDIKVKVNVKP